MCFRNICSCYETKLFKTAKCLDELANKICTGTCWVLPKHCKAGFFEVNTFPFIKKSTDYLPTVAGFGQPPKIEVPATNMTVQESKPSNCDDIGRWL